MILVRLMGGLGNQMFQYATGLRLARQHGTSLKLDLTFLNDRSATDYTLRDYGLSLFGLNDAFASQEEVHAFRSQKDGKPKGLRSFLPRTELRYHFEENLAFDPAILSMPDNTYLEGYFQDERYFTDIEPEIRARFRIEVDQNLMSVDTFRLAADICAAEAICVHVRRGDYVSNTAAQQVSGHCSIEYYRKALSGMRERGVQGPVFMFSDDPAWCQDTFDDIPDLTVVGEQHAGPKGEHHFWLMTLCHHFVVSNSTFSWWAAWLSGEKNAIIYRPQPWFNDPKYQAASVAPDYWIRLPR